MDFFFATLYFCIIFFRPQDWLHFLKPIHMLDILALPVMVAVSSHLFNLTERHSWKAPQVWAVLAFWGWMVICYAAQFFWLEIRLTFMYGAIFVLPFLAIALSANTQRRVDILLLLLFLAIIFFAIHGTLQHVTGVGIDGGKPYGTATKAFGIFDGPNEFASLFAVGIVLAVTGFRRFWPNFLIGIPLLATIPWFFMNLWWTDSRQSLITLSAGVGFAMMPKRIINSWLNLALAGGLFFGMMQAQGTFTNMRGDNANIKRAMNITRGLRIFKKDPVFGRGRLRARDAIGMHMAPHNSYLQVLVENGFPGLFFYVSAYGFTMLILLRLLRSKPENDDERRDVNTARMLLAVIGGLATGAFFQNRPYHVDTFVYLGLGAAFTLNMTRKYPDLIPDYLKTKGFIWKGAAIMGAATVGMIAIIHFSCKLFYLL